MTTQYRKFMKLLTKWPLDVTKRDRDLGKYLRERVQVAFDSKNTNLNSELCDRKYQALNRLADNKYAALYKRDTFSSATGLSVEECNAILSSNFLDYLQEEEKGILTKLFRKK